MWPRGEIPHSGDSSQSADFSIRDIDINAMHRSGTRALRCSPDRAAASAVRQPLPKRFQLAAEAFLLGLRILEGGFEVCGSPGFSFGTPGLGFGTPGLGFGTPGLVADSL